MLNYFKKILDNDEYKRIMGNILSLFSLQGINYFLPIITFPYLTRVLGPNNYGLIAFAMAFISYFQILTNYGFNLSATREIAINRHDPKKISRIFSAVMLTEFLLMILSFFFMVIIIFSITKFKTNWLLYFFTFGLVIGNLLLPTWFFQGMEKMKYISLLNIGTSLIFTSSIFIFIKNPSDYIYVPLINSISSITIGIISLLIIYKNFDIKFIFPSLKDIKFQLEEGWHIFISTLATSSYSISNPVILGFFANFTIVGYYSVAEKIIRIMIGLFGPVSQSLYPFISSIAQKSKPDALNFIKKITRISFFLSLIISILIFLLANIIVDLLAGKAYNNSILLIRILAFLPLIVIMSNIFGILTMLPLNYKKAYSNIYLIGSILNILLALLLTSLYQAVGISISLLITEIFITISMIIYLQKKGINLFKFS